MIGRRRRRRARVAALMEPGRLHVVEFNEESSGVRLSGPGRVEELPDQEEAALEAVGRILESHGVRGQNVLLVVRGFGVTHHILNLPRATPDVWEPIVAREMERMEPGMRHPVVRFAPCGRTDRRERSNVTLMAAAAPEAFLDSLADVLRSRQIGIEHLTVAPWAIQRAFGEVGGGDAPAVLLAMFDSGPTVCLFHEAELRVVVEPPVGSVTGPGRTEIIHDAIERAIRYHRQEHGGMAPGRLLLATPPGTGEPLLEELNRRHGLSDRFEVQSLGAPESLVALGAILDAGRSHGIDLAGSTDLTPMGSDETASDPHRPILAGALVVAAMWSILGLGSAWVNGQTADRLEARVQDRAELLAPLLPVLEERRLHYERTSYLENVDRDYHRLELVLRGLAAAVPPEVRLESLRLERLGGEWDARIAGIAYGGSSAAAWRAVQELTTGARRETDAWRVRLTEFDYLDPVLAENREAELRFRLEAGMPSVEVNGR